MQRWVHEPILLAFCMHKILSTAELVGNKWVQKHWSKKQCLCHLTRDVARTRSNSQPEVINWWCSHVFMEIGDGESPRRSRTNSQDLTHGKWTLWRGCGCSANSRGKWVSLSEHTIWPLQSPLARALTGGSRKHGITQILVLPSVFSKCSWWKP